MTVAKRGAPGVSINAQYTRARVRACIHTRRHRARICFPIWEPALNASDGSRVDLRRDICYFTVVSRFARGNKAIVYSTYTLRPSELTGRAANRRSRRSGMRGALSKSVDLRPHPVESQHVDFIAFVALWISFPNEIPTTVFCYRHCKFSSSPS